MEFIDAQSNDENSTSTFFSTLFRLLGCLPEFAFGVAVFFFLAGGFATATLSKV
jgi:hypothetical protein